MRLVEEMVDRRSVDGIMPDSIQRLLCSFSMLRYENGKRGTNPK